MRLLTNVSSQPLSTLRPLPDTRSPHKTNCTSVPTVSWVRAASPTLCTAEGSSSTLRAEIGFSTASRRCFVCPATTREGVRQCTTSSEGLACATQTESIDSTGTSCSAPWHPNQKHPDTEQDPRQDTPHTHLSGDGIRLQCCTSLLPLGICLFPSLQMHVLRHQHRGLHRHHRRRRHHRRHHHRRHRRCQHRPPHLHHRRSLHSSFP
mmetsp:Transcript_37426/g.93902  ORF Transcript_37426/g.93902 Transcript_37426/m.93902 type:complete len:207 (+) Transcript_37426:1154-1774(+)